MKRINLKPLRNYNIVLLPTGQTTNQFWVPVIPADQEIIDVCEKKVATCRNAKPPILYPNWIRYHHPGTCGRLQLFFINVYDFLISCHTVVIQFLAMRHTWFSRTPPIILSQFIRLSEHFWKRKNPTKVTNWLKWYSKFLALWYGLLTPLRLSENARYQYVLARINNLGFIEAVHACKLFFGCLFKFLNGVIDLD